MPAVVTFTISALTSGTRVTYYAPNSLTPGPVAVEADANGLVTLNLGNSVATSYLVTLPDGQWGHLPIRTTTDTVSVGTIPVYKNGVPPALQDITSLFTAAVAETEGGGDVNGPATSAEFGLAIFADETGKLLASPPNITIDPDTGAIESTIEYDDTGSFQSMWADLDLAATAGTSDAGDTSFLAGAMFNLIGSNLTKEHNYLAALIGALSLTGTRGTSLPQAAILGVLMDGAINGDSIVHAHIDGGDPSSVTTANAAFGVSVLNNNAGSGVDYGLDLKFTPDAVVDALMSGTAIDFQVFKALLRSPNDVCLLEGDGAPVNGTTGDNFTGPGSLYVDYTTPALYQQVGIISNPTWEAVPSAAALAAKLATASLLRSYLATTVTYNNVDVLADTALSVTVAAAGIYDIELTVHSTAVDPPLKLDFAGTATIANFIGQWTAYAVTDPGATIFGARVTAAGTDFLDAGLAATSSFYTFQGSVEITDAGTFLLRGAQSAAAANDTTILRGSTLILTKTN